MYTKKWVENVLIHINVSKNVQKHTIFFKKLYLFLVQALETIGLVVSLHHLNHFCRRANTRYGGSFLESQ
jgi:hypothetical protein